MLLDCVSGLVTTTLCIPVPAGVAAVIVVELVTFTPVAGLVPILTVAPLMKPVPVMVIEVPPDNGPPLGATDVTVGAGLVTVKPLINVPNWVSVLVTTTFHVPVAAPDRLKIQVISVGLTTDTLVPEILV